MDEMTVVFTDGHEEVMSEDKVRALGLTIANRFTLEQWKELQKKMDDLKISTFEDINFQQFDLVVSYAYVLNQVKAHSY